jgi:hypothetical protein
MGSVTDGNQEIVRARGAASVRGARQDRALRRGGYFHVGLHPVILGRDAYELRQLDLGRETNDVQPDTIRNISWRYESDVINGLDLDGFRIWSQGDTQSTLRHDGERLYGWEYAYTNVHAVDTAKAKRMAKTLTTIERRMDKLRETQGRPKTFGQFVAHVAKAIGAATLVIVPESQHSWDWRQKDRRFENFPAAIDHIDYVVNKLVEEFRPKEVTQ